MKAIILLAALYILFGCKSTQPKATVSNEPETEITTLKDPRDGKTYKIVKIGTQVWMAENLDYEAEGTKKVWKDEEVWNEESQSYEIFVSETIVDLCYKDKLDNCDKYGQLYTWKEALKVCPKGWHLPKNEEWDLLYKFVDSSYVVENRHSEVAGKYLKAKSGWKDDEETGKSGNGEDKYGFAALPTYPVPEYLDDYDWEFKKNLFRFVVGKEASWWSVSEDSNYANRDMKNNNERAYWSGRNVMKGLQSVRCVRD